MKPTKFVGGVGWNLISEITTEEEASKIEITKDAISIQILFLILHSISIIFKVLHVSLFL